jgi:ribosome-associated translation inhibitor RaiA
MQIQVSTDNHINGSDELNRQIRMTLEGVLERFIDRITRVEVHLSDTNSNARSGSNDKRCVMEARIGGLQPVSVSDDGESVEQVVEGAADKLQKTVQRTLERLSQSKGRTSFAGEETA